MSEWPAELLDEYIERLISGGDVQDLVAENEVVSEVFAPLFETSCLVASQLGTIEPSPQFKQTARMRIRSLFYARLARKESHPSIFFSWWQRRWTTAMATFLVVSLASMGLLAASVDSLPTGFFYPMKTTTEQVRLSLALSDVERVQLQIEFTERRLDEMTTMASRGDSDTAVFLAGEVTQLVAQMCSGALFEALGVDVAASQLVIDERGSGADADFADVLITDRVKALELLESASVSAPPELQPTIERLIEALSRDFDTTLSLLEATA
ncbi:MAG: hypothetical protein JW846_11435 [Dehalococcoidia bacterium]|nr:hypothetical protein [Dehalococcoidia bacterium]